MVICYYHGVSLNKRADDVIPQSSKPSAAAYVIFKSVKVNRDVMDRVCTDIGKPPAQSQKEIRNAGSVQGAAMNVHSGKEVFNLLYIIPLDKHELILSFVLKALRLRSNACGLLFNLQPLRTKYNKEGNYN